MAKVKKITTSSKKESADTIDPATIEAGVAEPGIIDDKLIEAIIPEIEEVEPVLEAEDAAIEDEEELETLGENWDE